MFQSSISVSVNQQGKSVQVLRFINGKLTLDADKLREILDQPSVKDLPVVVISIAGKMRHGKSFLLSNFVRYLKNKGNADWLSDNNGPLDGFVWKGGASAVTAGVNVWSQLFVVELPSNKKVAVMLMDCQGSFDTQSDVKESAVVFALSTMISSMQIYNIKGQLAGDDLLHLQMFTEYGKLAQKYDQQGNNAFQSLLVLIRDWVNEAEAAYGLGGGTLHLHKVLDVDCQANTETRDLARDVRSSFNSIECFLMPEPEPSVRHGRFNGTPSTMGAEFTQQLQHLATHVLSPGKLVVKQHAGREVKTSQLFYQFQFISEIFNSKKMPNPQSMLQANATVNYLIALDEMMARYKAIVEAEFNKSMSQADFKALSDKHREYIIDEFLKTPKMGGEAMAAEFLKHLEEKMDAWTKALENVNNQRLEGERLLKAQQEEAERLLMKQRLEGERMLKEQREAAELRLKKQKEEAEKKLKRAEEEYQRVLDDLNKPAGGGC